MTEAEVFDALKDSFETVVPQVDVSTVTLADSLRDLGANSIDRAEIITETLEQLGISIPMVTFADATDIGEIVAIMSAAAVRS